MRRDEILNSFDRIVTAVNASGIKDLLDNVGPRPSNNELPPSRILSTYANYITARSSYSELDFSIESSFGIEKLAIPEFWTSLIEKKDNERNEFYEIRFNLRTMLAAIDRFSGLLIRKSDSEVPFTDENAKSGTTKILETSKITFIVRENDVPELSLRHLSEILKSVDEVYDVIVSLNKLKHVGLVIGSMDSGSDKSIDVVGVAEAVNKLSALILESWDRIRFHRFQVADRSFKSVSEGLSIVNQIKDSVDKGSLTQEEADKMKFTVVKGIDTLFKNGVYIPEMETSVPDRPSQLPVERKKLIPYHDNESQNEKQEVVQEQKPVRRVVPRKTVPSKIKKN